MARYVFVTGGVVSSLGKGLSSASLAALFIICSLSLTIISRGDLEPTISVLDKIEESLDDAPKIPENNN